jgi:hypothetical protein
MKFALKPKIIIEIKSITRIANSRREISEKREIYVVFNVPNTTRLYNQTEYTADKTIPAVENNNVVLF